jgi:hypothetical protein
MFMDLREDPLDSVIEEIAAILATGYLRLCKARRLAESAVPPVHAIEEQVDGTHGANTS